MSGGVDSSACACILKNEGYDCIGATMRLHTAKDSKCSGESDILDAQKTCQKLEIPHHVVDFSKDFDKYVISNFISSYENGATPNPCIECNFHLKFDKLFEFAKKIDCDLIATGHYAIIEYDERYKRKVLKKAKNLSKDQSYVLYRLSREKIEKTIFPLGKIESKNETREIVNQFGLELGTKKESQDICFVPDGDYAKFIENYTKKSYPVGNFVTKDGKILGKHKGIIRYTIGQRKGLGLALPHSMYVCGKNLDTNEVIIGENEDLFSRELWADNVVLSALDSIDEPIRCFAKVRYNQIEKSAEACLKNGVLHVVFDEPQRAICKGQSVVLYDGDVVLGGGIISKTELD
ncbi:MAG: tRNA 2-thiouridine(34) synthase MnmA [Clostridia bacterium]|nr:tRNA 2-thiouridine(34) synthase MnmA [Clostridia bacterium]